MQNNRTKLADAIDAAREKLAIKGAFAPPDVARAAIEALEHDAEWPAIQAALILELATTTARRRITRAMRTAADPRQGWLALPEYNRVPQLIEVSGKFLEVNESTLTEYREAEAKLAKRIRSYDYPRRAEQRLKRDKETFRQMRKLEKRVAPLMAGDPEMKMGRAIQMHLESPAVDQRRKAVRSRWNPKNVRT